MSAETTSDNPSILSIEPSGSESDGFAEFLAACADELKALRWLRGRLLRLLEREANRAGSLVEEIELNVYPVRAGDRENPLDIEWSGFRIGVRSGVDGSPWYVTMHLRID